MFDSYRTLRRGNFPVGTLSVPSDVVHTSGNMRDRSLVLKAFPKVTLRSVCLFRKLPNIDGRHYPGT